MSDDDTPEQILAHDDEDGLAGMRWWNALSDQDRATWMHLAGNTGRAVDAWEAYKRRCDKT